MLKPTANSTDSKIAEPLSLRGGYGFRVNPNLAPASLHRPGLGNIFDRSDNMGKPWGVPTAKTWPPYNSNYTQLTWFCKEEKPCHRWNDLPLNICVTTQMGGSARGVEMKYRTPKARLAFVGGASTGSAGCRWLFSRPVPRCHPSDLAPSAAESGDREPDIATFARSSERDNRPETGNAAREQVSEMALSRFYGFPVQYLQGLTIAFFHESTPRPYPSKTALQKRDMGLFSEI